MVGQRLAAWHGHQSLFNQCPDVVLRSIDAWHHGTGRSRRRGAIVVDDGWPRARHAAAVVPHSAGAAAGRAWSI